MPAKKLATILLVEDVEEIRDAAEELLIVDGYHVVSARNEEDAVVKGTRCAPNILLVNLEGSSAAVIETARRIRERTALSQGTPILIFGADTISEGEEMELAGNIYLTRPDNFEQLRVFLRRLANQIPFELD
jgi:DNA-binding response OmpR family regulator